MKLILVISACTSIALAVSVNFNIEKRQVHNGEQSNTENVSTTISGNLKSEDHKRKHHQHDSNIKKPSRSTSSESNSYEENKAIENALHEQFIKIGNDQAMNKTSPEITLTIRHGDDNITTVLVSTDMDNMNSHDYTDELTEVEQQSLLLFLKRVETSPIINRNNSQHEIKHVQKKYKPLRNTNSFGADKENLTLSGHNVQNSVTLDKQINNSNDSSVDIAENEKFTSGSNDKQNTVEPNKEINITNNPHSKVINDSVIASNISHSIDTGKENVNLQSTPSLNTNISSVSRDEKKKDDVLIAKESTKVEEWIKVKSDLNKLARYTGPSFEQSPIIRPYKAHSNYPHATHAAKLRQAYTGSKGVYNVNTGNAIGSGLDFGATSGPSFGVFPNARIGGCAVPLLVSCSPSVIPGSLTKHNVVGHGIGKY